MTVCNMYTRIYLNYDCVYLDSFVNDVANIKCDCYRHIECHKYFDKI